MNRKSLTFFIAGLTLASFIAVGCNSANNNGNANHNGNANLNANANRADTSAGRNANGNMSREDFDRQKDSIGKQARDLGRTIGSGADDLWIWTKTRSALATADDLRDSTINVDVDNNVATLSGSVANAAQKARAVQVARSVEGVKNVVDKLQVSSGNANANRPSNANRPANANRRP